MADKAAALGLRGEVQTETQSGFVVFSLPSAEAAITLSRHLRIDDLVFSRQWVWVTRLVDDLPARDRLAPLLAALTGQSAGFGDLRVECPDTNEGKALSGFCRRFAGIFSAAAGESGLIDARRGHSLPRLHLFFPVAERCYVGQSSPDRASPWPMGIPRLRFPSGAPSRSTLKLAEALMIFLSPEEQEQRLIAGRRVVDLGAAPGGWSWQFASRGMRVDAVDNGPLSEALLATGMVEHLRQDGFRYRPKGPVDWMVCDMVEQPSRIAQLVAEWVARGDCRESIFNLKLPMKKRYAAVEEARGLITALMGKTDTRFDLRFKQLYHDREEVTGHLRRLADTRRGHAKNGVSSTRSRLRRLS